jgi:hypothetical protein
MKLSHDLAENAGEGDGFYDSTAFDSLFRHPEYDTAFFVLSNRFSAGTAHFKQPCRTLSFLGFSDLDLTQGV